MNDFLDDAFEGSKRPEASQTIAIANAITYAKTNLSLVEQKVVAIALARLRWKDSPDEQSRVIRLEKREIADALRYKSNASDLSQNLWKKIRHLPEHSSLEWSESDREKYQVCNGKFIERIEMPTRARYIELTFAQPYFWLFTGLQSKYCTLWVPDLLSMTSSRSIAAYVLMRKKSYEPYADGEDQFSIKVGTKYIKQLFGMSKHSYMRTTGFNRNTFEHRVLDPVCRDLLSCQLVQLVQQPNGRPYEKLKQGASVVGYKISWRVAKRLPGGEDKGLPEKSPKTGEERQHPKHQSAKPKGSFYQGMQHNYDYEDIWEKAIVVDMKKIDSH